MENADIHARRKATMTVLLWYQFCMAIVLICNVLGFLLNMDLLHVDSSLHCNDWPKLSGLGAAAVSEGWVGKHLTLSHLGL